ncbi:MAG TPA: YhjD/YihY/BrkB family envelope integrity protein [Polyangiaceae bacterium]|nr:YhjD/YihY/BrkB family envelope integrity protein [Polyangiaceae bacterium]
MVSRPPAPLATPHSSPAAFLVGVVRSFAERGALVDAGAMAFSLFLASIPMMGLVGSILAHGLSANARGLALISSLFDLAPAEVRTIVDRQFLRGSGATIAPVFLIGSLYLAAGAFHDAMTVFEVALGAERRSWIEKRAIGLACVVAFLAFLSVFGFVAVTLSGGIFALAAALFHDPRLALSVLPLFAISGAWIFVAGFFRVAVRRADHQVAVWPGATVTVAIGSVASTAFALYARSLADYAAFYGSLAAVAVFMVWLWICCIALLLGVETNANIDRIRRPGVTMPRARG